MIIWVVIDLKNLIVGGKFKCAILITCYPRQIKSLCVKSTRHWIIYKTSIYWINVESNFTLMWLTLCFSLLDKDKNTQTYNCVATLHLTCLFLLLSPNLEYGKKAFFFFFFWWWWFWRARGEIEKRLAFSLKRNHWNKLILCRLNWHGNPSSEKANSESNLESTLFFHWPWRHKTDSKGRGVGGAES